MVQLLRNLAHDPQNRDAIAKSGAIPRLVDQLASGSKAAMSMAASALALIALGSEKHRATVTQELVKLLASDNEAVRQRASEALRDVAAGESKGKTKTSSASAGGGAPLVNLLKDGLKDGNVEAQEYALWSLSSVGDTASREAIVTAGAIRPLIQSLLGGKISVTAQVNTAHLLEVSFVSASPSAKS